MERKITKSCSFHHQVEGAYSLDREIHVKDTTNTTGRDARRAALVLVTMHCNLRPVSHAPDMQQLLPAPLPPNCLGFDTVSIHK